MQYEARKTESFTYQPIPASEFAAALTAAAEKAGYEKHLDPNWNGATTTINDESPDGVKRSAEVPLSGLDTLAIGEVERIHFDRYRSEAPNGSLQVFNDQQKVTIYASVSKLYGETEPAYIELDVRAVDAEDVRTVFSYIVDRFGLVEADPAADRTAKMKADAEAAVAKARTATQSKAPAKAPAKGCLVGAVMLGSGLSGLATLATWALS